MLVDDVHDADRARLKNPIPLNGKLNISRSIIVIYERGSPNLRKEKSVDSAKFSVFFLPSKLLKSLKTILCIYTIFMYIYNKKFILNLIYMYVTNFCVNLT